MSSQPWRTRHLLDRRLAGDRRECARHLYHADRLAQCRKLMVRSGKGAGDFRPRPPRHAQRVSRVIVGNQAIADPPRGRFSSRQPASATIRQKNIQMICSGHRGRDLCLPRARPAGTGKRRRSVGHRTSVRTLRRATACQLAPAEIENAGPRWRGPRLRRLFHQPTDGIVMGNAEIVSSRSSATGCRAEMRSIKRPRGLRKRAVFTS